MTCTRCGYVMMPFDTACPACVRKASAAQTPAGEPTVQIGVPSVQEPTVLLPPPLIPQANSMPVPPAPRRRSVSALRLAIIVFFGLLGLMFVFRIRGWALSLVPAEPDTQTETSRSAPPP